jgi:hypothetical protein
VRRFVAMVGQISHRLGIPASIIEIHPGGGRNSYSDLIEAAKLLVEEYDKLFRVRPMILLENRTGQFVSSGTDIAEFWGVVSKQESRLRKRMGVILDIQQLYTKTKMDFMKEFQRVPDEAIAGFHIHRLHGVPGDSADPIPWDAVFARITKMDGLLIINPEIRDEIRVVDVIRFCNEMVKRGTLKSREMGTTP